MGKFDITAAFQAAVGNVSKSDTNREAIEYIGLDLIDDDPAKTGSKIYGVRVEGGMDRIKEICDKFKADTIVIAIMSLTRSQLKQIYDKCKALACVILHFNQALRRNSTTTYARGIDSKC